MSDGSTDLRTSRRALSKGIGVLLGVGAVGTGGVLLGSRPAITLEAEDWIVNSASSTTADGTIIDVTLEGAGAEINGGEDPQGGHSSDPDDIGDVLDGMDGDGSANDPYLITDDHELQAMNADPSAQYELDNPIDCTGTEAWNDGDGFDPIEAFTGGFDGNGYTVAGVTIDRPDEEDVGLFGSVDGGTVENVGVTEVDVTGNDIVGGLVGENGGTVSQSFTKGGAVTGENIVGGLVGVNEVDGDVSDSFTRCTVTGSEGIGGLIGANDSTVSESDARGTVEGEEGVGGLLGINVGVIDNTYAHGAVTGDGSVGGLVGENVDSGLLGLLESDEGEITTSYAAASVDGTSDTGGLVGNNEDTLLGIGVEGEVTGSYWDEEASGQEEGIGDGSGDVTGLTTDEMTGDDAEENMDALDFVEVWAVIQGGYPVLRTTAVLPEITERGDSLGVSWEGFHGDNPTIEFELNLRGVGDGFADAGATDFEPLVRGAYTGTGRSGAVELGWRDVFESYALPISVVNHPGISVEDFEAPDPGDETVQTLEVELVAAVPAENDLEASEVAEADITVVNSDE